MRVLTWLVALFVIAAVAWFVFSPRPEVQTSDFPIATPSTVPTPSTSSTAPSPPPTISPSPSSPAPSTGTAPEQVLIRGVFVIEGKEPDGDSVRFIAADPTLFQQLSGASRIKISKDGSVQLRFEGVDAPEVHYGKVRQPMGAEARDDLLKMMGFSNVRFKPDGLMVESARPASVPGAILSKAAEVNGRPISYVLLEKDLPQVRNGSRIKVDATLLAKTLNARLLETGIAYLTVYGSTPKAHRLQLREIALKAQAAKRGVWAKDASSNFTLRTQDDIGPNGQLLLPKLFRRATDYLADVRRGKFKGTLPGWLEASRETGRSEDDQLSLNGQKGNLSTLIEQTGSRVRFRANLPDLVFAEK